MSVTVKVFCQLAVIFLVAFLDQSIAKRIDHDEKTPKTIFIYSEIPSSEDTSGIKERDRRECTHPECMVEEFPENINEYAREQYWNKDDFEVEEGTSDDLSAAEPENELNLRKKRSSSQMRHQNHRYDDEDSQQAESKHVPKQYEVYEIAEDEESLPSEPRIHIKTPPPDVFVYNGVKYTRKPDTSRVLSDNKNRRRSSSESDSSSEETGRVKTHSDAVASGENNKKSNRDSTRGEKSDKGYKSTQHREHGSKGKDLKEKHAKQYDEHGGKKHSNHDEASNHGQHEAAAQGHKGAKFDEKEAHKKGHNTKGYHNKYQKDEYHKEHKFYDDHQKTGSHSRYGDDKSKHSSKEGGHKKKAHHDGSSHEDKSGKKGQYSKVKVDEGHKSFKNEKGYEKYNGHHSDYGKKGGHQGGESYAYHKY